MKKSVISLFAGIDSGGTKCRILLTDNELNKQFSAVYPSVHVSQHGILKLVASLHSNLMHFCRKAGIKLNDIAGIGIGAAGARTEKMQESIRRRLAEKTGYKKYIVTADTTASLAGALNGRDGFILISGTGSILYGIINNRIYRFGGWGKILGDQGSGYYIGRKALSEAVKLYDRGIYNRRFQILLKKRFGITENNIIQKVYHSDFEVQNLAPLVIECASLSDRMCRNIVIQSAEELLHLVGTAMNRIKPRDKIHLCLSGSILSGKNYLSTRLRSGLRKRFREKISIIRALNPPEAGAALTAINKFGKNKI